MLSYEQFQQRYPLRWFDPKAKPEPLQWLVEGLLLSGGKINGVFGTPKAGKSRFVSWLLAALLGGKNPAVQTPLGTGLVRKVLYLRGEEREEDIVQRLNEYAAVLDVSTDGWEERLAFMPAMGLMLEQKSQQQHLEKLIREFEPDLMVVDPYVRIHGADENDTASMAALHNVLRRWTDSYDMDLVLVHHTGKLPDDIAPELDISRWGRGSSDIAAIVDAGVLLRRITTTNVHLLRTGRYPPLPEMTWSDHGKHEGWIVVKEGA